MLKVIPAVVVLQNPEALPYYTLLKQPWVLARQPHFLNIVRHRNGESFIWFSLSHSSDQWVCSRLRLPNAYYFLAFAWLRGLVHSSDAPSCGKHKLMQNSITHCYQESLGQFLAYYSFHGFASTAFPLLARQVVGAIRITLPVAFDLSWSSAVRITLGCAWANTITTIFSFPSLTKLNRACASSFWVLYYLGESFFHVISSSSQFRRSCPNTCLWLA